MTQLTSDNKLNIEIVRKAVLMSFIDYPILQQLTLAQAILEGGLQPGRTPSSLAVRYNNLFGMKPGSIIKSGTTGIVSLMTTECDKYHCWKETQSFLSNKNIEDSIMQHEMLFRRLDRYKALFSAISFEQAAYRVKDAGYATDPHYPDELIAVYDKYIKQ